MSDEHVSVCGNVDGACEKCGGSGYVTTKETAKRRPHQRRCGACKGSGAARSEEDRRG